MLTFKTISNPKRDNRQDIDALMISLAFRKHARKHKKRHSTNRERSHLDRQKALKVKANQQDHLASKRRFLRL
jgi:hypothetical protein